MQLTLLMPRELDRLFRWPRGRAQRLARRGKLVHVTLPDGAIRFDSAEVEKLLKTIGKEHAEDAIHA